MQINSNREPGVFAALDAPATIFHPCGMGTANFAILSRIAVEHMAIQSDGHATPLQR